MMRLIYWHTFLVEMGILSLAIILIITAATGWMLYNIYLIIGWQWSALCLFLIMCVIGIATVAKDMDKN